LTIIYTLSLHDALPICDCIDLVVTSPPYDNIRDYHGFEIDLSQLGKELYRVLKPGGIVALVMQDQTSNFAKSLTTFRTVIDWCEDRKSTRLNSSHRTIS